MTIGLAYETFIVMFLVPMLITGFSLLITYIVLKIRDNCQLKVAKQHKCNKQKPYRNR